MASLVFQILNQVHSAFEDTSLSTILFAYSAIPLSQFLTTYMFIPDKSIPTDFLAREEDANALKNEDRAKENCKSKSKSKERKSEEKDDIRFKCVVIKQPTNVVRQFPDGKYRRKYRKVNRKVRRHRKRKNDESENKQCNDEEDKDEGEDNRKQSEKKPAALTRSKSKTDPLPRLVSLEDSFWKQFFTIENLLAAAYFSVQVCLHFFFFFFFFEFSNINFVLCLFCLRQLLRFNFYIGTNGDQLAALGDDGTLRDAFPWFPPLGAICAPFFGALIERVGLLRAALLDAAGICLFAVLVLVPVLELQWLSFLATMAVRPLHITLLFTYYFQFGQTHYGALMGFAQAMIGVSNQLSFALLALAHAEPAQPDFLAPNLLLLAIAVVLGVAFPVMVQRRICEPEQAQAQQTSEEYLEVSRSI